jgi:putative serine protease PepD
VAAAIWNSVLGISDQSASGVERIATSSGRLGLPGVLSETMLGFLGILPGNSQTLTAHLGRRKDNHVATPDTPDTPQQADTNQPEVSPVPTDQPQPSTDASVDNVSDAPEEQAQAEAKAEAESDNQAPASDEAGDDTGGVEVPVAVAPAKKPTRYQGSPFHPTRYRGIQDSIAWQDAEAQRQRKKGRARSSAVTVMLVVGALLGGVTGGSFAVWSLTQDGLVQTGQAAPPTITVTNPMDATAITAVAATALPSVVTLQVQSSQSAGSGSGVIISPEGHIITNAHVVSIGGDDQRIRVATSDGRLWPGTIVGADPISDIAVLKIDTPEPLTPISVGDSSRLNVGDETVAIGAPLGLANTVTLGIVSALNRSITVGASTPEDGPGLFDFDLPGGQSIGTQVSLPVIQTDASINPGNSGGALLNSSGELIGINVAIASNAGNAQSAGSIGLGFAIPANYAMRVANDLISSGRASHGLLGATVTDAAFDLGATISGAYIDSVVPGGPADQIGLRAGDIVTAFNQLPITNRIDLTAQVRVLPGGATTTITYVRGGQTFTSQVTLAELGQG